MFFYVSEEGWERMGGKGEVLWRNFVCQNNIPLSLRKSYPQKNLLLVYYNLNVNNKQRCHGIPFKVSRNLGSDGPSRLGWVDFGHFNLRPKWEHALDL